MKSKGLIIMGGIVGLIAFMLIGAMSGMGEIKKLIINDVDLTRMTDGIYRGSFHKTRWTYDVEVAILGNKITAVVNTNPKTKIQKGFNSKAAEAVIKKQSPKNDGVTGATISSKAFCKAVENALTANHHSGKP